MAKTSSLSTSSSSSSSSSAAAVEAETEAEAEACSSSLSHKKGGIQCDDSDEEMFRKRMHYVPLKGFSLKTTRAVIYSPKSNHKESMAKSLPHVNSIHSDVLPHIGLPRYSESHDIDDYRCKMSTYSAKGRLGDTKEKSDVKKMLGVERCSSSSTNSFEQQSTADQKVLSITNTLTYVETTQHWLKRHGPRGKQLTMNHLLSCGISSSIFPWKKGYVEITVPRSHIESKIGSDISSRTVCVHTDQVRDFKLQLSDAICEVEDRMAWFETGHPSLLGVLEENRVTIAISTAASSRCGRFEALVRELHFVLSLQLPQKDSFNFIRFSETAEPWRHRMTTWSRSVAADATEWINKLSPGTSDLLNLLSTLRLAFADPDMDALYLICNGPAMQKSEIVMSRVREMNAGRDVPIHVFYLKNGDDVTDAAGIALCKQLSGHTGGKYIECGEENAECGIYLSVNGTKNRGLNIHHASSEHRNRGEPLRARIPLELRSQMPVQFARPYDLALLRQELYQGRLLLDLLDTLLDDRRNDKETHHIGHLSWFNQNCLKKKQLTMTDFLIANQVFESTLPSTSCSEKYKIFGFRLNDGKVICVKLSSDLLYDYLDLLKARVQVFSSRIDEVASSSPLNFEKYNENDGIPESFVNTQLDSKCSDGNDDDSGCGSENDNDNDKIVNYGDDGEDDDSEDDGSDDSCSGTDNDNDNDNVNDNDIYTGNDNDSDNDINDKLVAGNSTLDADLIRRDTVQSTEVLTEGPVAVTNEGKNLHNDSNEEIQILRKEISHAEFYMGKIVDMLLSEFGRKASAQWRNGTHRSLACNRKGSPLLVNYDFFDVEGMWRSITGREIVIPNPDTIDLAIQQRELFAKELAALEVKHVPIGKEEIDTAVTFTDTRSRRVIDDVHASSKFLMWHRTGAWVTVKLFVSSTLEDFHSERDMLNLVVFPALRERCCERRIHLVDIDMRWLSINVPTGENKADFIKESLKAAGDASTIFLFLGGQRYGWVPLTEEFPLDPPFESLSNMIGSVSMVGLELYHGCMHTPDAGLPLCYFRDSSFTASVPKQYQKVFRNFQDKAEMLHDMVGEKLRPSAIVSGYGTDSISYSHVDNNGRLILKGLEKEFALSIFNDIWSRINVLYPEHMSVSNRNTYCCISGGIAIQYQSIQHDIECDLLASYFLPLVSHRKAITEMEANMNNGLKKGAPVLVVSGADNSGRSTALAYATTLMSIQSKQRIVVRHFVGTSLRSNDIFILLRRIHAALNLTPSTWNAGLYNFTDIAICFKQIVLAKPDDVELLVVIDDVHLLECNHVLLRHALAWLDVKNLPTDIRFLVSAHETSVSKLLKGHKKPPRLGIGKSSGEALENYINITHLSDLSTEDLWRVTSNRACVLGVNEEVVAAVRNQVMMKLNSNQCAVGADTPLYAFALAEFFTLSLASRIMASFQASHSDPMSSRPPNGTKNLSDNILTIQSAIQLAEPRLDDLLDQLLQLMELKHGRELTTALLASLSISPTGLLPSELRDLLGIDFFPLPMHIFIPLRRSLESGPWLSNTSEGSNDNVELIIRSQYIRKAILRRYAAFGEKRLHRQLAYFFYQQADPEFCQNWNGSSRRAFERLPIHLAGANLWDELYVTLNNSLFSNMLLKLFHDEPESGLELLASHYALFSSSALRSFSEVRRLSLDRARIKVLRKMRRRDERAKCTSIAESVSAKRIKINSKLQERLQSSRAHKDIKKETTVQRPKLSRSLKRLASPEAFSQGESKMTSLFWLRRYAASPRNLIILREIAKKKGIKLSCKRCWSSLLPSAKEMTSTINSFGLVDLLQDRDSLRSTINILHRRLNWIMTGTRVLLGCLCETDLAIVVDVKAFNAPSLHRIQTLILESITEQMNRHDRFNVVGIDANKPLVWSKALVRVTDEALKSVARWMNDFWEPGSGASVSSSESVVDALCQALVPRGTQAVYLICDSVGGWDENTIMLGIDRIATSFKSRFGVNAYIPHVHIVSFGPIPKISSIGRRLAQLTNGRCHASVDPTGLRSCIGIEDVLLQPIRTQCQSDDIELLEAALKDAENIRTIVEESVTVIEGRLSPKKRRWKSCIENFKPLEDFLLANTECSEVKKQESNSCNLDILLKELDFQSSFDPAFCVVAPATEEQLELEENIPVKRSKPPDIIPPLSPLDVVSSDASSLPKPVEVYGDGSDAKSINEAATLEMVTLNESKGYKLKTTYNFTDDTIQCTEQHIWHKTSPSTDFMDVITSPTELERVFEVNSNAGKKDTIWRLDPVKSIRLFYEGNALCTTARIPGPQGAKAAFRPCECPSSSVTVEAWVKLASETKYDWSSLISCTTDWTDGFGLHTGVNDHLHFFINDWTGVNSSVSMTLPSYNEWFHVAGTYDHDQLKLYLNGNLVDTKYFRENIRYNNNPSGNHYAVPVMLANSLCNQQTCAFRGHLADVRIWTVARAHDEIWPVAAIFGNEEGLIAHYCFSDGGNDSSKHGHHASLFGAAHVEPKAHRRSANMLLPEVDDYNPTKENHTDLDI